MIELAEGIRGVLRASEISAEKVEDARTKLQVGDTVEAKIMGTDRKIHAITLSIKAKDAKAPAKKAAKATKTAAPAALLLQQQARRKKALSLG